MGESSSGWPGRLLGLAASVLLAVLLLRWAVSLARPLLPWLVVGGLVVGGLKLWLGYQRRRW